MDFFNFPVDTFPQSCYKDRAPLREGGQNVKNIYLYAEENE